MTTQSPALGILVVALATVNLGVAALAQTPAAGPPNALQGFSQNRDKPIKINSASLEVRDKDKMATFAGDVHLVQGDTTLRSRTLVVFYEDDAAAKSEAKPSPAPAGAQGGAQAGAQQNQQIKRVEAKGDVIVQQKDQTATGESGIFDMKANTVTLLGNVVISQGQSVVKGDRLTVDMTTGVSRVECGKPPCRVQALLNPGAMKDMKDAKDAKPDGRGQNATAAPGAARDAQRPRPPQAAASTNTSTIPR
jgi:lipopolysaccharide export system protein LptA